MSESSKKAQKERQREKRKIYAGSGPNDSKNAYGKPDPTPYLAIKHIRANELKELEPVSNNKNIILK